MGSSLFSIVWGDYEPLDQIQLFIFVACLPHFLRGETHNFLLNRYKTPRTCDMEYSKDEFTEKMVVVDFYWLAIRPKPVIHYFCQTSFFKPLAWALNLP